VLTEDAECVSAITGVAHVAVETAAPSSSSLASTSLHWVKRPHPAVLSVMLDMRDHLNASAQVVTWLIAGAGLEPATPAL
jgi:hypothetical protein